METLIKVNKKEADGIIVFAFEGELDETNADKTFTQIYNDLGGFSGKKVIFNLKGLKYLNSKSIGYIADIYSNIEENDSEMYISDCDDSVRDILDLVGITTIVPTVDTMNEAITALKS